MKTKFISAIAALILLSFTLIMSCDKKEGCTDPTATNYDSDAKKNCCCEYATPPPVIKEFKLDITKGTTPIQDGIIDAIEWSDAKTANLYIASGSTPTKVYGKVYVKHDGQYLWVAYAMFDTSHNVETDKTSLYIDKDYDRAKNPQATDFIFELRRNDTANNITTQLKGTGTTTGTFLDWTVTPQGAWTAIMTNQGNGAGSSWRVEYKVPFSDINITAGAAKTIGINFGTSDNFNLWPGWVDDSKGTNWVHPNTWGSISSSDNWQ